jgi:hypothetical protein
LYLVHLQLPLIVHPHHLDLASTINVFAKVSAPHYVNIENNAVTITPLKDSNARQLKIGPKLTGLLNSLPKKWTPYVLRNPKIDPWKSSRRFRNLLEVIDSK